MRTTGMKGKRQNASADAHSTGGAADQRVGPDVSVRPRLRSFILRIFGAPGVPPLRELKTVVTLFLAGLAIAGPGSREIGAAEPETGFGLLAHWPFDEDYASMVNDDLYRGQPNGGSFIGVINDSLIVRVGAGALRLDSGPRSGNGTYVSVPNPLFGYRGAEVFTVVAWYRFEDLSDDGSDNRNFVWESKPGYSLAFGLRSDGGDRDAEWWFQTGSGSAVNDTTGPIVAPGEWSHVAMIWNKARGRCKFYHDGSLRDDVAIPSGAELEIMTGFHIGNHRAGDGSRDWDGYIDDVAVYDLELTPAQIRALFTGRFEGRTVHAGNVLERVPEPTAQTLVERPPDLKPPLPDWHALQSQGPLVGHTDDRSAIVWARIPVTGTYDLEVRQPGDGTLLRRVQANATESNDWCLHWTIPDLQPDSTYQYSIHRDAEVVREGDELVFRTAPDPDSPAKVTLAFGSCADFEASSIWTRMGEEEVDGVVILGDTPYIDTTELDAVRNAYRRFSSISTLAELLHSTPFWGTWDDHDFGRNDSDGTLPGKENSRRGFVEYRPNPTSGHADQGIYTQFRYGPVEVFLLDTRWFARTEDSWADPTKPTLLGQRQWQWLQEGLLASDARFKILACGMIWDDKENSESDDWGTYHYEREALQTWLGDQRIEGVVLMGGDIHVSRLLKYNTARQVGYPLYQFITSPLHGRVIPSLNVPHPALVWSAAEPFVFLKLTADTTVTPATLKAVWMTRAGEKLFEILINEDELSHSRPRAAVERLTPAAGQSHVLPLTPIEAVLVAGDEPVSPDTIRVTLNGVTVGARIENSGPGEHRITFTPGFSRVSG